MFGWILWCIAKLPLFYILIRNLNLFLTKFIFYLKSICVTLQPNEGMHKQVAHILWESICFFVIHLQLKLTFFCLSKNWLGLGMSNGQKALEWEWVCNEVKAYFAGRHPVHLCNWYRLVIWKVAEIWNVSSNFLGYFSWQ